MKLNLRQAPIWLEAQRPLAQWYSSALGQSILDELELRLSEQLVGIFGYQGMQIGQFDPERDFLASTGIHRRLLLDAPGMPADIHADVLHLPIASDTMKVVIFFHTLDFCSNPHQALREADRVLTEDGQLIVIGFNPISVFGLRHLLSAWSKKAPWNGRFYFRQRIKDWLSVLNYRVMYSEAMYIRPPINSERILSRLRKVERLQPWLGGLGGLYVLQARKQTIPMTMTRLQWRKKRTGLTVGSLASISERSRANDTHEKKGNR